MSISRDARGVPHIKASSFLDAAFAIGYVQAQDRFWQMDTLRRTVRGENAAVFGANLVELDLKYRVRAALPTVAKKSAERIDEESREIFQAYADGVNLAIRSGEATRSPEWDLLGVDPEPWTAADVTTFMTVISETATDGERELLMAELEQAESKALTELLTHPLPSEFPTLYRDFGAANYPRRNFPDSADSPDSDPIETAVAPGLASFQTVTQRSRNATNFFVLAASKTTTGGPILAVDPHLPTHAPGFLYPLSISLPNNEIAGAAWIGSPSISFGQNSHIAWGMTHLVADTADYIVEKIDPADPTRYLTPEGSRPFEYRAIEVDVKDAKPQRFQVRQTQNGVVVSDRLELLPSSAEGQPSVTLSEEFSILEEVFGPGHVVVRRQVGVAEGHTTMQALVGVSRAKSWDQFRQALRAYEWTNNFVYADTEGNIGVQMAARLPRREIVNGWNGQRLARGWLGEGRWSGYVAFDELPYVVNPSQGWIADSNCRAVEDVLPYRVTSEFSSPWRVLRSYEVLESSNRLTLDDVAALQTDALSTQARALLQRVNQHRSKDPNAKLALALLRDWDLQMTPESSEALLYGVFEVALQQRLINVHKHLGMDSRPNVLALLHILDQSTGWCDHPGTDSAEDCSDAVEDALNFAWTVLEETFGSDSARWRWGDVHGHRFSAIYSLENIPALRDFGADWIESPGGNGTLNVAATSRETMDPNAPLDPIRFTSEHGATYRLVADLADRGNSRMAFAPGISGNPFSKHWNDASPDWAMGLYQLLFPDASDEQRITRIEVADP
ncbi:MAG: penicillin acylase family protein [Pseudomonadota bacterium]